MSRSVNSLALALLALLPALHAQSTTSSSSCSLPTIAPTNSTPMVAPGFAARVVANNLTRPRGIKFDSAGNLLVVQQGVGVVSLNFTDNGGSCVGLKSMTNVVEDSTLDHGIEFSYDGRTLYASSAEALYSWGYDPSTSKNTSSNSTIVNNMATTDHTTRTLLLSRFVNGTMLVTRGSTANIDPIAFDISSGHSEVRAFDLSNRTANSAPYDFDTDGIIMGWGLRNDVGIDEHPVTGAIYTVENSADQIMRNGVDVHMNNPGEEMNFLGFLNDTSKAPTGSNYGYPACFTAWNVSELVDEQGLVVGSPFAIGNLSNTNNDTICHDNSTAPRLTFQAHMAPLDILFNPAGSVAWVTFHGSWDRMPPVGYKVSTIDFNAGTGDPMEPNTSTTALTDVMINANLSACPDHCFRPVGLAFDSHGRLFVSSDATGEVWMITEADGNGTSTAMPSVAAGSNSTGSSGGPSASSSKGAAAALGINRPTDMIGSATTALLAALFMILGANLL